MGTTLLKMLQALACRGPDGSGVAILRSDLGNAADDWVIRVGGADFEPNTKLAALGTVRGLERARGETVRFRFSHATICNYQVQLSASGNFRWRDAFAELALRRLATLRFFLENSTVPREF